MEKEDKNNLIIEKLSFGIFISIKPSFTKIIEADKIIMNLENMFLLIELSKKNNDQIYKIA